MDNNYIFPKGFDSYDNILKSLDLFNLSKGTSQHPMCSSGILVAFSGGPDSMALFHLTAKYCEQKNLYFYACHVNHGIRGEEAIRDRDFCIDVAKSCQNCKDIFVLNTNVPLLAQNSMRSIELEARIVRYTYFERVMKENDLHVLATAHNADDNIETLLFNLSRGSGVKGMCGIPQMRTLCEGITIFRPILSMSKDEILEYCNKNALKYVFDSTNADTEYSRNILRAKVVPILLKINSEAKNSALRLSKNMRQVSNYMEIQSECFLKENIQNNKLPVKALSGCHEALLPFVIQEYAHKLNINIDFESVHIEGILRLCQSSNDKSEKYYSLPNFMCAKTKNGFLTFEKDKSRLMPINKNEKAKTNNNTIELNEGVNVLDNGNLLILQKNIKDCMLNLNKKSDMETFLHQYKISDVNIYKFATKVVAKSDTIGSCLRIKYRQHGDKIFLNGMHKSVKKLMCDYKIPNEIRNLLPIIWDDKGILWIPYVGLRKEINGTEFMLVYVEKITNK